MLRFIHPVVQSHTKGQQLIIHFLTLSNISTNDVSTHSVVQPGKLIYLNLINLNISVVFIVSSSHYLHDTSILDTHSFKIRNIKTP